jgi:hypothetical protein
MTDIPLAVRVGLSAGSFSMAIGVCLMMISLLPWLQKPTTDKFLKCGAIMLVAPFASFVVLFFIGIGISMLG